MVTIRLLIVILPTLLPVQTAGQGYDPECFHERLRQLQEQRARLGNSGAGQALLEQEAQRARAFIEKGAAVNQELRNVQERVGKQEAAVLTNSPEHRSGLERLRSQQQALNPSRPEEVRRFQRAREEFEINYQARLSARVVLNPNVDRANAAANLLQIKSDNAEAEFFKKQFKVGVPPKDPDGIIRQSADTVAKAFGLSAEQQSLVRSRGAWSQAANAYAVYESITRSGQVVSEQGYGLPKEFWDSNAGGMLADVAARTLVGGMALHQVGQWGGSSGAVDMRDKLGPETRSSVSALAANGLSSLDRAGQGRRAMEEVFRKNNLAPSSPQPSRPQRPEPPSPAVKPPEENLSTLMNKIPAVLQEAGAAAKKVLYGPPIVVGSDQQGSSSASSQ